MNLDDFRYERKFIISELSLHEIERLIKFHPAMFFEIFHKRTVNNIYLDSINLENYWGNLAGNSERLKIRIRWYGEMFGVIRKPILELKIKNNELGRKKKFLLKAFRLNKKFSGKLLQKVFANSDLPKWLSEKLKLYQPTLLNSYKRRYFISNDKKHRITLDWDFNFLKIKNKNNLFCEKIINKDKYVLELKYGFENCEKTKDITKYFPFRLIAHSKYVSGIELF